MNYIQNLTICPQRGFIAVKLDCMFPKYWGAFWDEDPWCEDNAGGWGAGGGAGYRFPIPMFALLFTSYIPTPYKHTNIEAIVNI